MAKAGYELEFEDTFETLDLTRWLPSYLPQWTEGSASAARYEVGDGALRLRIDADQEPWCPEFDGPTKVSSLQTGVFAGPVGSTVGQQRFHDGLTVRQSPRNQQLYTPQYGLFELRAKAIDDPRSMVALWMIGYEDEPERSAEICVAEIFGHSVTPTTMGVGMGLRPFADPTIHDDFAVEELPLDVREVHTYGVEWTPEQVTFFVDGAPIRTSDQSPAYPMQFMLSLYEFAEPVTEPPHPYPKEFAVESFRAYRRA